MLHVSTGQPRVAKITPGGLSQVEAIGLRQRKLHTPGQKLVTSLIDTLIAHDFLGGR